MYVAALVIPVPDDAIDAYRVWAENSAAFFREYGCIEVVDCLGDNIPAGKETDFRRAVAAKEGETVALSWQIWPDKESFYRAEERMHEDPRMDAAGDPPFDPRRLILGCFEPIHVVGRG